MSLKYEPSSEQVQSFDTTTKIAIATFPRPVKKGYLYKVLQTLNPEP